MLPIPPPRVEPPSDLIPLAEACRLIPSHRAGKRLHIAVLRRWVQTGRLAGWRRGRWWFVSRADVVTLAKEQAPAPKLIIPRGGPTPAWARKVLERHGIGVS